MEKYPYTFPIDDHTLVPSDADWVGPYQPLEAEAAQEKFGGKTIAEIIPFVSSTPMGASLYFIDMPPVPFRYYIRAFVELLRPLRIAEIENSDAFELTSSFLRIVLVDLRLRPSRVLPIMEELIPTIDSIRNAPAKYGYADELPKGDVPHTFKFSVQLEIDQIMDLYRTLQGPPSTD